MEQLLHYCWKHKIFPIRNLETHDGRSIEIINPGIYNTNAGPDFIGAKILIDGVEWGGNVEMHLRTSDWFRHHHDSDPSYHNVILHVASVIDRPLFYPDGGEIPQLQLQIPQFIIDNYDHLLRNDSFPKCRDAVLSLPKIFIHNWLTTLTLERFEERAKQIMQRRDSLDKNWEDTLFVTLARNFGFGVNGDAFEAWARSIPMSALAKHRDSLFQIEAMFFGQAGLLDIDISKVASGRLVASALENKGDDYFCRLRKEYLYLAHKFSLTPIDAGKWKFLRLRPQNFPYVRIAQLAMLYYEQHLNISRLINFDSIEEIYALLSTHVSEYWLTHYSFNMEESKPMQKTLSPASLQLVIVNTVAPILFAYGRHKANQDLCDKAFDLWQQMKPENNRFVRDWLNAGVKCESAADSQAVLQLTNRYCHEGECLRCRFGGEYIRSNPQWLREEGGESYKGRTPNNTGG